MTEEVFEWMAGDRVREVMIPPERCVYYLFGCNCKRYLRNFCWTHYHEARESGDLAPFERPPAPACMRCRSRKARHGVLGLCDRCRKQRWRENNREHVREYKNRYDRRQKLTEKQGAAA